MMKNNPNVRSFAILMVICVIAFIFINACKRESYTLATTDDVNITGYLDKYPEKFSMMRQIVERSGTAGYLGAYGRYTLFTPTNDAVTAWLKGIGKANVSDLTVEQSKDMVKFHLLPDTVATNRFTDGKLPQITLYGQYLQTGAINDGGVSSYIVNKQAKINQSNVRLGNGIIHVIDHVLIPATLTTAQTIEASGRYKYFTQALKETGFYDSLNVASSAVKDTTRRLQTAIIESDSALVKAGYSSYEAFKAKFSKTGDPKNHSDSLWLYIAYHLSAGATYTPDIIASSTINTLAPKEVVTTKYVNQRILLNDDEFNGILEPGVEVNRTFSNITTANGVLHETKNLYAIKVRYPTGVFFDVCDQPELKANPIWRGRNGATGGTIPLIANGAPILSGMRVNNPAKATLPQNYDYFVSVFGATRRIAYDDKLNLSLGLTNANRAIWVELKTPMLVKGKYKVWICYSQFGSGPLCQIAMDVGTPDAQVLPNLIDFRQTLGSSGMTDAGAALASSDPLMLAQGFKRYLATTNDKDKNGNLGLIQPAVKNNWPTATGRLAGTVNITTTDRHWIRLTMVGGAEASSNTWLDMIHFIPENDDQNYPRFSPGKDGLIFQKTLTIKYEVVPHTWWYNLILQKNNRPVKRNKRIKMKRNILHIILLLSTVFWLGSCKNALEEHSEIVNVDNSTDLLQKIASQSNLSKFAEYVRSTGYDKLLTSSQTYTVWAPTNDALATLDAAIVSDPVKLKDFVANHIGLTATAAPKGLTDTVKVLLQNTKYATMVGPTFEEAAIVGKPAFVKNGALYVIDKAVPTKLNVWDFMLSSTDAAIQTKYIANLSIQVIDTANATIIGYNALGNPIFAPNPPMVSRNAYWNSVADLRTESQQYTFFMLQDATFNTERNRLEPFYPNGGAFILVRDLVAKGLYTLDKLPDTLISTRGVKIPIKKSAIVKSYRASNGIVYVMNALPFRTKDKVPTFKIEGEFPFSFRSDRTGNTLYRLKLDDKGISYKDIEVYNHGVAEYYVQYLSTVASVKYKVYARAISGGPGDAQVANFTQRYFIYNPTTLVFDLFATQTVTPLNYAEVYLGDYTPQQYGTLQLRLTAANTTSVNQNTLILDYLRFEPILP